MAETETYQYLHLSAKGKQKIKKQSPTPKLSFPTSMDTLSSSVSTFKVPTLHSTATCSRHEVTNFKSTTSSTLYSPNTHLFSTTKPINSIPTTRPTSFTNPIIFPTLSPTSPPPSPVTHRKPAAGYAAALLDIAQTNNSVDSVGKDVERFSRILKNNRVFLGEEEKGRIVMELVEKGSFNRYLVCLVKMLVKKNKVGVLSEVLDEFEKIYNEVLGTQVVLISSKTKMEEKKLSGIARRVQKLTGAVKVKVRNLVCDHNRVSFAV